MKIFQYFRSGNRKNVKNSLFSRNEFLLLRDVLNSGKVWKFEIGFVSTGPKGGKEIELVLPRRVESKKGKHTISTSLLLLIELNDT